MGSKLPESFWSISENETMLLKALPSCIWLDTVPVKPPTAAVASWTSALFEPLA